MKLVNPSAEAPSAEDLARTLEKAGRGLILVVTGAGVSLASGIATFRGSDPDAVWHNDLMELGTYDYFQRDPVGSWQWSLGLFGDALNREPNPAHHAIADLERWQTARGGSFLLVTQNVDILHEKAGSRDLIKVHGTAERARCTQPFCKLGAPSGSLPNEDIDIGAFLEKPSAATLPKCPECGSIVRQHVLWFDEYYTDHEDYQFPRVQQALEMAHVVLFVGTSLSVGVTDMVVHSTASIGIPVFLIDPGMQEAPYPGVTLLREKAEELLPAVYERLAG